MLKRSLAQAENPSPMQLLRKLAPPQAIIHVGAGTGVGELAQWRQWDVPNALIVDANPERLAWAEELAANKPGWRVLGAALSDTVGDADYYQASNPEEDGLLPPEQLAGFWPNLRTSEKVTHRALRLDQLLAETDNSAFEKSTHVWALIDCLPALTLIKGAGEALGRWSVVCARVLLQPTQGIDHDATLESLADHLQAKGFKCIHVSTGNHPAIGHAIFVKDWQAELSTQLAITDRRANALAAERDALLEGKADFESQRQALKSEVASLAQARDEQAKLATDRQAEMQKLAAERDVHARTAAERQAIVDALGQKAAALAADKDALLNGHVDLDSQRQALQSEVGKLAQARDEQAQLATDRQAEIQKLARERDAHAQAATERQAQVDELSQKAAALAAEKDALLKGHADLESQRQALQAQIAERDARQQLLNDEITRAEAQIDLIKDVLLREPSL